MSNDVLPAAFDQPELLATLKGLDATACDQLSFGVIGFDAQGLVRLYNTAESKIAGLSLPRVLGHPLFTVVAPCMNNYLVAQRFEDQAASGVGLDTTLDYVLTLRMRPVKVTLRLLADSATPLRYVIVRRAV